WGPIWMPVNLLLYRAFLQFHAYPGDAFKVECPTGSGQMMTLFEVEQELARRLIRIFLRDERGQRPVYGGVPKLETDPHWRDHFLFYEYFHGYNGAGLGASAARACGGVDGRPGWAASCVQLDEERVPQKGVRCNGCTKRSQAGLSEAQG